MIISTIDNPPRSVAKAAGTAGLLHIRAYHPYSFESPMAIFEMRVSFLAVAQGIEISRQSTARWCGTTFSSMIDHRH